MIFELKLEYFASLGQMPFEKAENVILAPGLNEMCERFIFDNEKSENIDFCYLMKNEGYKEP